MNLKTWTIPAKTFLLGEYVALAGGPAIVATTRPCFEVTLIGSTSVSEVDSSSHLNSKSNIILPSSPAGRWWHLHQFRQYDLTWHDPYQGIGGFGASSAQFIGSFLAGCSIQGIDPSLESMLTAYFQMSTINKGLRPSGYDVIAQTQRACVYIHHQAQLIETNPWPFTDIGFLLLHTGKKLTTHDHLRCQQGRSDLDGLVTIVETGWQAFQCGDSTLFADAVNAYQRALTERDLMAAHTQAALAHLQQRFPILAAKGCGAMGADVVLLIIETGQLKEIKEALLDEGWQVVASHQDLEHHQPIFCNFSKKKLEILS